MQPNEALSYLVQLAADFMETLPPSARGPVQMTAQASIDCLAQFVAPPAPAPEVEADNVSTLPPRKPKA